MSTATVESMVAKATQLRANNALYRTHNAQLAVDLPFSNRQRLCELEQDMGSSLVETLRSHP
jgi:hypothetical protein